MRGIMSAHDESGGRLFVSLRLKEVRSAAALTRMVREQLFKKFARATSAPPAILDLQARNIP
jgi:hypothetical protein